MLSVARLRKACCSVLPTGSTARSSRARKASTCIQFISAIRIPPPHGTGARVTPRPQASFAALALRLHRLEPGVECDLGLQEAGDRAAGLGRAGRLLERRRVGPRDARAGIEMDPRDGPARVPLLEREARGGADALGLEPGV